jgi:hypothetical protein
MTQTMPAAEMPAGTIVASKDWVAIKVQYPRVRNLPWEVAGSGVPNASDANIDQLISLGRAYVLRNPI